MQKLILSSLAILATVSFSAGKCGCHNYLKVYLNGVPTNYNAAWTPQPIYVSIGLADSICYFAMGDQSMCFPNAVTILDNQNLLILGSSANGFNYTFSDTGHYQLEHFCNGTYYRYDVYVSHNTSTSVSELVETQFQIYPAGVQGIFKIDLHGNSLHQLLVWDCTGRMVIAAENVSEIDLSASAPGMYLYAITDEKENTWRGKVIK